MVFCYESLSRLRPYEDFRLVLEKLPLYISYLLSFHVNSLRPGGTCAFSLSPEALAHSLKPTGYTTFVELDKTEFTLSLLLYIVIIVQLLSCVQLFATPRTTARQVSLSFTISQSLLKFHVH